MQRDGGHWIHPDHTREKIRKEQDGVYLVSMHANYLCKLLTYFSACKQFESTHTNGCTCILNSQCTICPYKYAYSRKGIHKVRVCMCTGTLVHALDTGTPDHQMKYE